MAMSRRQQRGFSTVELAVSLGLFLVLSVIITLAVARTMGATSTSRAVRAAETSATDSLNKISAGDYEKIVNGTFSVPDPCDAGNTAGINATTCVTNNGVDIVIGYSYQQMSAQGTLTCTPGLANSTTTASTYGFVGLCANVETIGGVAPPDNTASATEHINSPSPKYAPSGGVVRINVNGNPDDLPGRTVYLVRSADPSLMVGSATVNSDGLAYIATTADPGTGATPSGSCTASAPCMVALMPGSSPAQVGTVGLYGPDAREQAGITTPKGKVVDASVRISAVPTVRINLDVNINGQYSPLVSSAQDNVTNPAGSVCLWARIDDSGTRNAPLCNSANPSAITATSYTPDGSAVSWPLPTGGDMVVTTDNPSGSCPIVQKAYDGATGTFVDKKVCTSWTWGTPSNLPATLPLSPSGSTTYFTATWTPSPAGNPAAGWPGTASASAWTHPRSWPACANSGTCSTVVVAPEETWCPGQFCRYNGQPSPPDITSPTKAVVVAPGQTGTFTVHAATSDKTGTLRAYQLDTNGSTSGAAVTSGTLSVNGSGATASGSTAIATGTGVATWTYSYTRPPGYDSTFTVKVRLCQNTTGASCASGATRSVTISAGNPIGVLGFDDATLAQNSDGYVRARLAGFDGAPIAAIPVTFNLAGVATAPGGTTTVATGTDGVAVLPIHVNANAPVGANVLSASVPGPTGVSATSVLTVTPVGANLALTPVNSNPLTQGGSKTFKAKVTTASSAPVAKVAVSALVTGPNPSGGSSSTVFTDAGCITDTAGECVITVNSVPGATVATYTINAASGGLTRTTDVNVVGVADQVIITPDSSIAPGSINKPYNVTVIDKAGSVLAGATLSVTGDTTVGPNPPTNTPVNVTTNGSGVANLNVTALLAASDGGHTLRFTQVLAGASGLTPIDATVTVSNSATIVTATSTPVVAQQGSALLQVVVKDSANRTIAGRTVNFSSTTSGLSVDTTAVTDSSGVAVVHLFADTPHAGTGVVNAWTDSNAPTPITVSITATPDSVTLSGALEQGASSTLTFTLYDAAGDLLGNAPFGVGGLPPGVSVTGTMAGVTTSGGTFTRLFTDNGPLDSGTYMVTVTSGASFSTVVPLTVQGKAANLTSPTSALTIKKGNTATAVYTVSDARSVPIPAYPVSVAWSGTPPCANSLSVDNGTGTVNATALNTRGDGTINVDVYAPSTCTSGTYQVLVTAGTLTRGLPVTISAGEPSPATAVAAVAGNKTVTVTWVAPSEDGGSPVTGYTATVYNAATDASVTTCSTTSALTCTVSGLSNGTSYYAKVTATNTTGTSSPSAESSDVTPSGTTSAPSLFATSPGNGSAAVTWTAPTSTNGTAVDSYQVSAKPDSAFRTNLMPNPSVETTQTGWFNSTNGTASVADSASTPGATPVIGSKALRMTAQSAGAANVRGSQTNENPPLVTGGLPYTFSMYASTPNATQTVYATLQWRNSAGTTVATTITNMATVTAGGAPTRIVGTTTPPATATNLSVILSTLSSAAGDIVDFDAAMLEQSSTAGPYFDGATTGAFWTGTGDASPSKLDKTASYNLLPNPSFEDATVTGWTNHAGGAVAAVTTSTDYAYSGTYSAKIVTVAGGRLSLSSGVGAPADQSPVTAGTTYTYRTYLRAAAGSNMAGLQVYTYFFNAAGTQIGSNTQAGTDTTINSTGWTSVGGTVAAPAGAATTAMLIYQNSTAGGSTFYVDASTITPTSPAGAYFDGNSTNASWTGTRDRSPSLLETATYPTCTTAATSCTLTGLTNANPYWIRVNAHNGGGWGASSAWSTPVTPSATVPDPPANVTTAAGNASATITWNAPANDGGYPITSYTATVYTSTDNTSRATCTTTTTTCAVSGLSNGTGYYAKVTATNASGTSQPSTQSLAFTPATIAGSPANLATLAGSSSITASWDAPTNDGGAAIDSSTVTAKPPTAFRTNLITNPSFENNTATPWINQNNSVVDTSTAGGAVVGTYALRQHTTSAGLAAVTTPLGTAGIPVTAGQTYTFSSYGHVDSGTWDSYARIRWYNAAGTELSGAVTSTLVPMSTSYVRTSVTGTAPAGAVYAAAQNLISINAAVHDTYWDAMLFEVGNTTGNYFDGTTTGAFWNATANNSTSTLDTTSTYNLIANPNFENGTAGWAPIFNASGPTQVTGGAAGTYAARFTSTAATANTSYGQTSPRQPVTAGTSYTATAAVRASAAKNLWLSIRWYDNAGNYLSESPTATNIPATTTWDLRTRTAVAPAGAATAAIAIAQGTTVTGDTYDFDAVSLVANGTTPTDLTNYLTSIYFDGSSAGASWTSSENYSASIKDTTTTFPTCTTTTTSSCTLTGLTPATGYRLRVNAHNRAGWGNLTGWSTLTYPS